MLEQSLLEIIEGRKKAPVRLAFLRALSQLMRAGVAMRHFAYDQKLLNTFQLSIPVISVGNIIAGGSGKTPFVRFLAGLLSQTHRVAVISRGYRSQAEKQNAPHIVSLSDSAALCGDEPLLLAKQLPQVEVIVGQDRIASARLAEQRGAQLILLDDGMQHRRLHRDLDIALLPSDDPFGRGFFLPGGLLRDAPERLGSVDLIALTYVQDETQFNSLKQRLARYSSAPVVGLKFQVKNTALVAGKRVAALCAIARPERFLQTLKQLGCEVVHHQFFPDHSAFPSLEAFEREASKKGAELLVCTEKDRVKIDAPFTAVEMELVPYFEPENLQKTLEQL